MVRKLKCGLRCDHFLGMAGTFSLSQRPTASHGVNMLKVRALAEPWSLGLVVTECSYRRVWTRSVVTDGSATAPPRAWLVTIGPTREGKQSGRGGTW